MKKLTAEFKVGLFVMIALATILIMIFIVNPDIINSDKHKTYYTILTDAAGIVNKTHVKTNGVTVGSVMDVKLRSNTTRVLMEVKSNVEIPKGSTVEIRTRGLLGDVFLEIIRGPTGSGVIEDGGEIPVNENQVDLQQLISLVGSIGRDLKEVSVTFAKVLGGEEGEKKVGNIVEDIEKLAKNTREMIEENRQDVRSMISSLEETAATLRSVIGGNESQLQDVVANVRDTTASLKEFSANINDLVKDDNKEKLKNIIASFDAAMQDVEETAENIKLVSQRIESGEGTLGRLVNDDEALTELEGAIKDIREVLSPATKLRVAVDYHAEVRQDETTQNYFNLVFRTRPDKFYLLGFTDHDSKVVKTQTQIESDSPDDERKTETIQTRNALRFNVQFGKRWGFFQARFGLFESTGGLATDFFLGTDRLKFSFEAFDWDSVAVVRRTAHMKTYVSVLFFDHVYAVVGIDDFTRLGDDGKVKTSDLNYFFGAGLTFNDDDLKAMFGTAALAL